MLCPRRDPRSRFGFIRPTTLLLFSLLLAAPVGLNKTAEAAPGEVLILDTSVSGGTSSLEAIAATDAGKTPVLVDAATWGSMAATDFADYDALVLGDPTCSTNAAGNIGAAVANANTWGPVVDGNVIIIGSDPALHRNAGALKLITQGMAFAVDEPGRTGGYIDLSCYYHSLPSGTPVPVLDGISGGGFVAIGASYLPGLNDVHIVASHPALTDLTDADLSDWGNSVHEGLEEWPIEFQVLAIARDPDGSYNASDGTIGYPYILARGEDLQVISDIDLAPATASRSLGASITLTATVVENAEPLPETLVTFEIISGPNSGMTGNATTGSEGTASFTYSNSTAGTDVIVARFVDADERTQTSNQATVDWGLIGPGIYGVGDWAEAFDLWTYEDGQSAQHKIGFLAARSAGVHVLDVTDPESVQLLGVYAPEMCEDGTQCHVDEVTFVEEENAIHVSLGGCGVHIVDVANARNPDNLEPQSFEPRLLEVYDGYVEGSQSWVEAVAVRDGLAYVADYDALRIFDVSEYDGDPTTSDIGPELGSLGIDPDAGGPVGNVVLYYDGEQLLALVATGDGMRVLNVDDPSNPTVIGTYQHPTDLGPYAISQDIAVDPQQRSVLLPAWVGGLSVVDISGTPEEIDSLSTDVAYYTAVPYGDRIYATEGIEGLRVLELVEGTLGPVSPDPIEVGSPGEDWAWDVVVADCVAYVTFGNLDSGAGGLQVSPLEACEDPDVVEFGGGQLDNDLDGVADAEDNCLETSNADQTDSDLDGFGNACDADYDGDGTVGTADFLLFSAAYGAMASDGRYDPRVDHNVDGVIDEADFIVLSQRWGNPPGP